MFSLLTVWLTFALPLSKPRFTRPPNFHQDGNSELRGFHRGCLPFSRRLTKRLVLGLMTFSCILEAPGAKRSWEVRRGCSHSCSSRPPDLFPLFLHLRHGLKKDQREGEGKRGVGKGMGMENGRERSKREKSGKHPRAISYQMKRRKIKLLLTKIHY